MGKAMTLHASYDRCADVLYVVTSDNAPARARMDANGILWRRAFDDNRVVGATIMDYTSSWRSDPQTLESIMSRNFHVSPKAVRRVLSGF